MAKIQVGFNKRFLFFVAQAATAAYYLFVFPFHLYTPPKGTYSGGSKH